MNVPNRIEIPDAYDGEVATIVLPDGREVLITWNNIEDDALPELEITLPVPMVVNCWLENMEPAVANRHYPNALASTWLGIPIPSKD